MTTLLLAALLVAPPKLARVPNSNHFAVIAHRGAHEKFPENSLAGYEEASRLGCDYGEMDLRTTKDGQLINMHDSSVDRTTDGKGKVRELTFDQIRQLHLKNKPGDDLIHSVPTFREVLKTAKKGRLNIYLDFKDADPKQAWAEIRAEHMERSVLVYVYSAEDAAAWRAVAPLPIISDMPNGTKTGAQLAEYLSAGATEVLDGPFTGYTRELSDAAKAAKVFVWPDIQNPGENPVQWQKALDAGVNGLQTDHPEGLIEFLAKSGVRKRLRK